MVEAGSVFLVPAPVGEVAPKIGVANIQAARQLGLNAAISKRTSGGGFR